MIAKLNVPDLPANAATQHLQQATSRSYNDVCVPEAQRLEAVAATGLIAGISLGGLLGALAIWSSPDVLSKDQTSSLISQHNGSLLKRLRGDRSEVRVAPYASARGGGLTTVVAF